MIDIKNNDTNLSMFTEDEILFLSKTDWQEKKELRELSFFGKLAYKVNQQSHLYKQKKLDEKIIRLRLKLRKFVEKMEVQSKRLEEKNLSNLREYIKKTKTILELNSERNEHVS